MAVIGQTLHVGYTGYSDWFAREAMNAVFNVEVIDCSPDVGGDFVTVAIDIYHKNNDEAGSGTYKEGLASVAGAGTAEKVSSGLKELVRFKYSIEHVSETTGWASVRMNRPVWYESAES